MEQIMAAGVPAARGDQVDHKPHGAHGPCRGGGTAIRGPEPANYSEIAKLILSGSDLMCGLRCLTASVAVGATLTRTLHRRMYRRAAVCS